MPDATHTQDTGSGSGARPGFFHGAQNTDARGGNFVDVGSHFSGTMTITNSYQVATTPSQRNDDPRSLPRFIDPHIDLLSPHFTGHVKDLEQLQNLFDTSQGDRPTQCAIYGMPGLGKTQLALQYAKTEYDNKRFSHVFWISSTTVEKLQEGFARVLYFTGKSDLHQDQEAKLMFVRDWFEKSGPLSWLIVLDNVSRDTVRFLRTYLPHSNAQGRILYTTRTQHVADLVALAAGQPDNVVHLDVLDVKDAAALFLANARLSSNDSSSAAADVVEQMVNCVGRLPLAIVQAASFKRQSTYSIEEMLVLYKDSTQKSQMIQWDNDLDDYEAKSVAAVLGSLLEHAFQDTDTGNFLKLLSFFDPESIALNVIIESAKNITETKHQISAEVMDAHPQPKGGIVRTIMHKLHIKTAKACLCLSCTSNNTFEETEMVLIKSTLIEHLSAMICSIGLPRVIRQLQELSLVYCTGSVDATVLHMHDLTSFLVREMTRVDGLWEDFFDCTVNFIGVAIDNISDSRSPKCWPQCALIASHVQSLANIENIQGANQKLLGGRFVMAEYMHSEGRYKDAETLYMEFLKIKQETLGSEHPHTLAAVNNLATVYDSQGNLLGSG
ncbi:hypothetical protein SERLA73DRAFT_152365 [Serpula lacrymans var. lacrymans S7.3]|uniref:NB-ARC domain-containing protein n=1 Tax=Serpula lacrymans var. lacrymans (strain S7.3) TaxID=936435 RepID=F8PWL7_SERL3|nr:hypothetical protein SERLA73DRAFT_152365 [Serpula lacrymans var. lacrymans S7.3]